MNLHICIDGCIEDSIPLIDGNDVFNAAAERTALDKAYEIKSSDDDAVVTILIDLDEVLEDVDGPLTAAEANEAADALDLLRDLDEGEDNVDGERLAELARLLRRRTPEVDHGPTAEEFDAALAADAEYRAARASGEANEELTQAQTIDAALAADDAVGDRVAVTPDEYGIVRAIAEDLGISAANDHWCDFFWKLNARWPSAINEAIALIRTHAIDPEHPLAVD